MMHSPEDTDTRGKDSRAFFGFLLQVSEYPYVYAVLRTLADTWGQTRPDMGVFYTSRGNQKMVAPLLGIVTNKHKWDYL